jgi:glucokinase
MRALVGIDIGGTKTAVILGSADPGTGAAGPGAAPADAAPGILARASFPTGADSPWQSTVSRAVEACRSLLGRVGAGPREIAGIGISCGGPLDSRAGLVLSPPNLPGWDRVPITAVLSDALGAPAALQNDANACALAEWKYGAGRGCSSMVFLTFGTGMGAGLILGGRLYEGASDLAGEVGHLRLAEDGPLGYGKRGSFEGFCSGGGIANLARARAAVAFARGTAVAFSDGPGGLAAVTAQAVGEAAEAGDALAREILAESGRRLGQGLAMLIDVLNPERIVIGSIYVRCRAFLEPSMRETVRAEALEPAARACAILPAALGDTIGDYASLAVAARAGGPA